MNDSTTQPATQPDTQPTLKLNIKDVFSEAFATLSKNFLWIVVAVILWFITIWIPYINIGTTIAIQTIPIAMSKGVTVSPMFIFDKKYRYYMGDFFLVNGFLLTGFVAALGFFGAGFVLLLAWSQAVFLVLDKGINPAVAISKSNELMYGNKMMMFLICVIFVVAILILQAIFGLIPFIGGILVFGLWVVGYAAFLCVQGAIFGQLTRGQAL